MNNQQTMSQLIEYVSISYQINVPLVRIKYIAVITLIRSQGERYNKRRINYKRLARRMSHDIRREMVLLYA